MAPSEPVVGTPVEVPAGRGIVRFAGQTSFAVGKWYGIELEEPKGKNDGSVHGVVYFSCRMNYGMFVRGTQIKILGEPEVHYYRAHTRVSRLIIASGHSIYSQHS